MKKMSYLILSSFLFMSSCSDSTSTVQSQPSQPISDADECHLCGMLIKKYPGPKGEIYQRGESQVKKFCSTVDLFSYLLQPENQANVQTIYVHDMAQRIWNQPDDTHFIDARPAWYVIGHKERGAMGTTLASFAKQEDAEQFIARAGGKLIRFNEVTLEMLSSMK